MLVVPALVNKTFCEALLPTFTFPKAMVDGLAFNTDVEATAVPVMAIDCGELTALLVTETPPLDTPATVGANVTVKGVDCPAFTVTGPVTPFIENPVPEAPIALIVSGAVPLLEIATVCEAVPPTDTFPKLREFGVKLICGMPPMPLSGMLVGEDGSLLVTMREPEVAPEIWGANCTGIIWLCPTGMDIDELPPTIVNPLPVVEAFETTSVAVPEFAKAMLNVVLLPTATDPKFIEFGTVVNKEDVPSVVLPAAFDPANPMHPVWKSPNTKQAAKMLKTLRLFRIAVCV